jgi:uncharacterized protein involved in exopolysaccharide biosynthesis
MEVINRPTNKQDELDLLNLLEKGFSFFKNFGKLIIIFSLAGLGLGILYYMLTPKKYSSRLILHSKILTNQEEIEIIETWQNLLKKREYATLAAIINCNEEVLKKTNSIQAVEIQKLYVQDNPNGFIVDVMVLDTAILDDLQKGIIYGLENSYYVKERVETKKANLNDLIAKVIGEITNLDSTKKTVTNIITNKNKTTSPLLIDVSGINTQWINLNEKLLNYQEELKFIRAVQVLQGFNKLKHPEGPKLLKSLVFSLAVGAFMGYIFALFKYIHLRIKNRSGVLEPLLQKQ